MSQPIRSGGHQSNAVPTRRNTHALLDNSLYRCMVTDVIYVDAGNLTENSKSKRVLYNVVVLGGNYEGNVISNCRVVSDLSSNEDYHEIILKASTKSLTTPLTEHDGSIVYLMFNQGDRSFPVIIGGDNGIDTEGAIGGLKADGKTERRKFNGRLVHTDKDGVHKIIHDEGLEITEDPTEDHYQLDSATVNIGRNTVDNVALAQRVLEELIKVQTDLATLKAAVASGLGALTPAAGSVAAVAAFNGASTTVPQTPTPVASSKVRTA